VRRIFFNDACLGFLGNRHVSSPSVFSLRGASPGGEALLSAAVTRHKETL
jgi:hypothetical protein